MTSDEFEFTMNPCRIIFGPGRLAQVGAEVERLGRSRVLVLASPELAMVGDRVQAALGQLCAGRFDGAAMHTPVDVTQRALDVLRGVGADCVVAVGGGSTTGLSKALAVRTGVDQVILPTTYAGSEVTPVLGETADGAKTTRSSPSILPEAVIYDVELSRTLPVPITVTSAINALAHAVESLYSPQASPVTDAWALDAVRSIARGLKSVTQEPANLAGRSDLLRGAWLAGTCLGSVGMGLHHKLCHVLGGTFGLPHAATHTIVLAHVMAYNAPAAPEAMHRIAAALEADDAPGGVFDLVKRSGGPTALRDLGLRRQDLDIAARQVVEAPYPNPVTPEHDGVVRLLANAWIGAHPVGEDF